MPQVARAPGRVNLIGDHTDYTGGLVMPMAIDRATTIEFEPSNDVRLTSGDFAGTVQFALPTSGSLASSNGFAPATVTPTWGRYVAGVVAAMIERGFSPRGFAGQVSTTVPIGGGLSSSAALEVAAALAFGIEADSATIAAVCRRAEHLATSVPCGIMDQLTSVAGVRDHALVIDCHSLDVTAVAMPESASVWVVPVSSRTLDGSEYPARVAQCAAAEAEVGPLRLADLAMVERIGDPVIRARARHVVSENQRVRDFATALSAGDLREAGRIMYEGHRSLRNDFATSTPSMDDAVEQLGKIRGVHGVRMTGGGFGGCVVVLADDDADVSAPLAGRLAGMRVRAADGASVSPRV
ncbi:MAG: galactokinase [Ilumatobacteraceae bacterium]|nr:galactokinase [Actinomycetota bacterium]